MTRRNLTAWVLSAVAEALWRAGDLAGATCTACYRLAGRLTGWSYEVRR
ncbi:MAG: hypothetical protein HQL42_13180 [Alphaproteobacteria bacterium]|nr:hypothetical protein [Alphaproteobacteria bacterium]